ncbi:MAG: ABC transporter ATP-binding protein [Candidatus Tectimicrobiota bacterium]|nr:MAG: ABC transporter ATP-binding protein [Candidatus Tectomicrobia bacterium]
MALLRVQALEVAYGELTVLRDVSLEVAAGEVVAIVGSNGAGKTTLLKTIAGLLRPHRGQILYDGRRIDGWPAHRLVRLGIAYVPAERELFPQMTVRENLELGAYLHPQHTAERLAFVFDLFPRLGERQRQLAGTLSGGEQQMLAIGRGLMSRPAVLLLDEPSTGLAPLLVAEMYRKLQQLKEEGLTLLLAEQQVPMALSLAERAYVLESGRIRLQGQAQALLEEPAIKKAYLGVADRLTD